MTIRTNEPAAPTQQAVGRGRQRAQRLGSRAARPATLHPPLRTAHVRREHKMSGHIKPRKTQARFLKFGRYLHSLHPSVTKIAIIYENLSPRDHAQRQPGLTWVVGEQRRGRLHADEFVLVKPRRGTIHGAVVTSRWTAPATPAERNSPALSAVTSSGKTTTPATDNSTASWIVQT